MEGAEATLFFREIAGTAEGVCPKRPNTKRGRQPTPTTSSLRNGTAILGG